MRPGRRPSGVGNGTCTGGARVPTFASFPEIPLALACLDALPPPRVRGVPDGRGVAQEALALSGGGSRGLAHAGVFLGLAELGYEPDVVVGNSAGAVVGALYAAGYDPSEIRKRILAEAWDELFVPTPWSSGPIGTSGTRW